MKDDVMSGKKDTCNGSAPSNDSASESSDDEDSTSSVGTSSNDTISDSSQDGGNEDEAICLAQKQWKQHDGIYTEHQYIGVTCEWTKRVPIGLGLCPWAVKSLRKGNLRLEVCMIETTPLQVSKRLLEEARRLVTTLESYRDGDEYHTTLLVCPKVEEWNTSFDAFDDFVNTFWTQADPEVSTETIQNDEMGATVSSIQQEITLVAFHPSFMRWRGLPEGVQVGDTIKCHKAIGGFKKSQEIFPATILETANKVFGSRKIRVEFADDRQKQYVPVEWCVYRDDNRDRVLGPPLPDNAMHQSPFPTIHLIRNRDLGRLRARDVSRVKRKNAQRMMKLGTREWGGGMGSKS